MLLVFIFEVFVVVLMDEKGVSRKWVLVFLGSIMIVLVVLVFLLFGKVDVLIVFIYYVGVDKLFFDVIIDVFYEIILLLNGLLICIFVIYCWKSVNFNVFLVEGSNGYKGGWFEKYVDIFLKIFIFVILLVIFINMVVVKYFDVSLFG